MNKHQRAHARLGIHHHSLSKVAANIFGPQQFPKSGLIIQIRARGISKTVALAAIARTESLLHGHFRRDQEIPNLRGSGDAAIPRSLRRFQSPMTAARANGNNVPRFSLLRFARERLHPRSPQTSQRDRVRHPSPAKHNHSSKVRRESADVQIEMCVGATSAPGAKSSIEFPARSASKNCHTARIFMNFCRFGFHFFHVIEKFNSARGSRSASAFSKFPRYPKCRLYKHDRIDVAPNLRQIRNFAHFAIQIRHA